MTGPAETAVRFVQACLLGGGLGLVYGFLRPLRPRFTALADGIFLIAMLWVWLYLGFAICRGDLRLGYTAGLAVGAVVFDRTAGIWIRPVFWGFWRGLGSIWGWLTQPVKNFFKKSADFAKKIFSSAGKWVTIKWNNHRHLPE